MISPRRESLSACVALVAVTAISAATYGGNSGSALGASRGARPAVIRLANAVPAAVTDGAARLAGEVRPSKILNLNLGLPLRHQSRLHWFITHRADHGVYMTKLQFDHRFGPTARHSSRVAAWARAKGLHVTFLSRDHLIVGIQGPVARVDAVFHTQVRRYVIHGHTRFANASAPAVPSSLGIQTVTGLDDIRQAVKPALTRVSARRTTIPEGGLTPDAIRTAYDLNGHTVNGQAVDGTNQTVGITGFGETVPNSDFKDFAENVVGPALCDPSSGPWHDTGCPAGSSTMFWDQIGGAVTDDPDIDEQALDAEYVQGLAPHVTVNYYLGQDGADWAMEQAIDDATIPQSIHVVSNSWGDPGWESASASNEFVVATQNYFEKAVATGTTFYFSTGDNAEDSGCSDSAGNVYHCVAPSYPADSPYVVAVGGTNLQLNANLSAWSSESTWNLGGADWGSGGGCAPFFARPKWQTGAGVASCRGRATPDISAAGDPGNSPINVWDGGAHVELGGTSVAATLISGMAIDTNSFLTLEHAATPSIPPVTGSTQAKCSGSFCWMGWSAPEIYRLAQSPDYNADFHDVVCGSNTWPARQGWDEATGWGSIDWFNYSQGFAGMPVTPVPPAPSWLCQAGTGAAARITAIACTPVYHCHLAGQSGTLLHASDGWHWHTPTRSSAAANMTGIACPTISTCYAVGTNGWLQKTTDGGKIFKSYRIGISSPTGIACLSKTNCIVVGSGIATTSNGTRFAIRTDPVKSRILSISCAQSQCAAVSDSGKLLQSANGSHWQIAGSSGPAGKLQSISCQGSTCYAVGQSTTPNALGGDALVYSSTNRSGWSGQTLPGNESALVAVSCSAAKTCDAVGASGQVLRTIDGSTWSAVQSMPRFGLDAIACPSTGLCFAAGEGKTIFQIGASRGH